MPYGRGFSASQHGSLPHGEPTVGSRKGCETEGRNESRPLVRGLGKVVDTGLRESHQARKTKTNEDCGRPQRFGAAQLL